MFSPSPSSAAVFQREMLPRVTLGMWFSIFGHLVLNFGIGMSVNFPRDLYYIWTGSVFVLFSSWLASEIHRGGRMDGWMKAWHWIPRVMDFLWTFAVAIVGVFLRHQKRFPCAKGFPRIVATVLVPLSLSDQFLTHKVTAWGGVYTARRVCPVS